MTLNIEPFYDANTATMTYVVWCGTTKKCAIIDSVLDYDPAAGRTSTLAADKIIDFVKAQSLKTEWILETHIHADHLTGAPYLKRALGGKIGIGEHIKKVIDVWVPIFNTAKDTPANAIQFDHLFTEGETFKIGNLSADVMHTPGHTPACLTYHIEDAIFVGDTMFMPHLGTARVDFPGGSAEQLYNSIHRLLKLPNETRVFVGHSYPPAGEKATWETTIKAQKTDNIMLNENTLFEEYKEKREARDKTLGVPRLLLPSIQVNIRAGALGEPEDNGIQYLKIPLNKI